MPDRSSGLGPLCAIVDVEVARRASWEPRDLASAFLTGGAPCLQLRAKALPSGALLEMALQFEELTRAAKALLVVNDRADVAALAGAGLHVGQEDLAPAAARAILGSGRVLGLSTHTRDQVDAALGAPIDYVAVGPVFGTVTKDTGYSAVGLAAVRYAVERAGPRGLPVVAIGGITLELVTEVVAAGAETVAVITDLLTGGDPETRVREYRRRLADAGKV
jgi:thiamine-phosphate pyrophosphorylase